MYFSNHSLVKVQTKSFEYFGLSLHLISDRLQSQKLFQPPAGIETTPTRFFGPSMRKCWLIMHAHPIDMYSTSLDQLCNLQSSTQTLSEDSSTQPILGVVGHCNGFLFGVERDQRDAWPKRLGIKEVNFLGRALDYDGSHARLAYFVLLLIAVDHPCAFGHGIFDQSLVLF